MPAALRMPEIRLHPGADAAFVQALYRDVVIASRCLVAGRGGRFLVGQGAGVDAPAPGSAAHPLVATDERGFTVSLAPGMTGTVIYEDRAITLGAASAEIVVGPEGRVRLGYGPLAFMIMATAAPPVVSRPRRRIRDHWAALVAGAAVFLVAVLLAFLPPDSKTLSYEPDAVRVNAPLPWPTIPEVIPPTPGGAAAPAAAAGPTGAATPGPTRRVPRPVRHLARPEPEDPRRAGILGVFEAVPGTAAGTAFSTHSALDDAGASALEGLQGTTLASAAGTSALGSTGTGAGGPGDTGLIGLGTIDTIGKCADCVAAGDRLAVLGKRRLAKLPEVTSGLVTTRGSLDKEIIRRVVRRHLTEVKYCYERELVRLPALAGRVVTEFAILPTGRVATALLASSTVGNLAVESCVLAAVRRWEFPAPVGGGAVMVTYPFVLTPAGAP
jgi:TonB family protein